MFGSNQHIRYNTDMNEDFAQLSQKYIGMRISSSPFNLDDKNTFIKVDEPYVLSGRNYDVYLYRYLTGYKPDKGREEVVKYTFAIMKPDEEFKKKFMDEVTKQQKGEQYDGDVIGEYYSPFVVGQKEFDELYKNLALILGNDVFANKGYVFGLHTVTVTPELNPVLVFAEVKSFNEAMQVYDSTKNFDPEG